MKIEKRLLENLKPAEYNPRQATEKQQKHLTESLKKFGVVEPVIVNENKDRKNIIVGGHFRVRELTKLGYKEVDCVIVDLPLEDEKELNIRLNANTGSWDFDMLANQFDELKLNEWGLEVPSINNIEVDMPELASGDKEPFQQVTFTLADEQANLIQEKLSQIKKSDAFKYIETFGNQNSNGNALYTIIQEWDRLNK